MQLDTKIWKITKALRTAFGPCSESIHPWSLRKKTKERKNANITQCKASWSIYSRIPMSYPSETIEEGGEAIYPKTCT
jgi:hypothetical protein